MAGKGILLDLTKDSINPISSVVLDSSETPEESNLPIEEGTNPLITGQVENLIPDIEEEHEEEHEEEGKTEESEPNPYFYLGKKLASEGFLPEDFEIGETVDGVSVFNAFKEKLKVEAEPRVRQEVYDALQQEGVNETTIYLARALHQGEDLALLNEVTRFDRFANLPEDVDEDMKIKAIRSMYQTRLNPEEIDTLIKNSDDIDKLFAESKKFHKKSIDEWKQHEQLRAQEVERATKEAERHVNDLIRKVLTSQEVMGEKLTKAQAKEMENSIYNLDQVIEVEGQKFRASEMQKFLIDWENNPELKLYLFKKWKYRDTDKEEIKKEIEKEVEDDMLSAYAKKVVKDKRPEKAKKVKEQLSDNKFLLDFSQPKK